MVRCSQSSPGVPGAMTALLLVGAGRAPVAMAEPPLRGLTSDFREENYVCTADTGFVQKCVPEWQEECRHTYAKNKDLQHRLCETQLNRNYVRIRTLIPPEDILDQWSWDKKRRDYDEGFFRTQLPKYTDTGFKLMKLPDDLHQAMLSWYRSARHMSHPEGSQPAFGMHCNTGHDNDDWQVPLSLGHEQRDVFARVKEWIRSSLSEWTGQEVNENTATYGVRQYHRGSICGMHTDSIETHAFSAIYQLDQEGMDEPWALDYVTHQGEEGKVFLKAGDVMLYESATGLHGRKTPLKGDEFANIFIHFRSPTWLPAVRERMQNYWPKRTQYEQVTHTKLTSLADAPRRQRNWKSNDQCIPLRNRNDPLMVEGHFMDTPGEEAYNVTEYQRQHSEHPRPRPRPRPPPIASPQPQPVESKAAALPPAPSPRPLPPVQLNQAEPVSESDGIGGRQSMVIVVIGFLVVLVGLAYYSPWKRCRKRYCADARIQD